MSMAMFRGAMLKISLEKASGWRDYVLYGVLPLVLGFTTPEQKPVFRRSLFEKPSISDIIGRNNVKTRGTVLAMGIFGFLLNPDSMAL